MKYYLNGRGFTIRVLVAPELTIASGICKGEPVILVNRSWYKKWPKTTRAFFLYHEANHLCRQLDLDGR